MFFKRIQIKNKRGKGGGGGGNARVTECITKNLNPKKKWGGN